MLNFLVGRFTVMPREAGDSFLHCTLEVFGVLKAVREQLLLELV